jgi:hypothetical protein
VSKILEEVESVIEIDMGRLDEEWVRQPALFLKYAAQLADARQEHAEAKADIDVVRADVSKVIRGDPDRYGVTKVTEASIDAAVTTHKQVEDAVAKAGKAKHRMDLLQAAVDALEHRKKALENLVFLHGQEYFSEPRTPKGKGGESMKERQKEAARRKVRFTDD